jgi:cyclophilin family peptidyl-prolyl cis-trans isomerase
MARPALCLALLATTSAFLRPLAHRVNTVALAAKKKKNKQIMSPSGEVLGGAPPRLTLAAASSAAAPASADDVFDMDAYKADPNNKDDADLLPGPANLGEDDMLEESPGFEELMAQLREPATPDSPGLDELMAQLGGGDAAAPSAFDAYGGGEVQGKTQGQGKTYVWQQTEWIITVAAPVEEGTPYKQIKVDYPSRSSISMTVKGEVVLEGDLGGSVDRDDSFWSLEEDKVVLDVQKASGSREFWDGFLTDEGDASKATVTKRVYFDIEVDGEAKGRVEFGLFGDDVPTTVLNFASLCEGVDIEGTHRSYAGSPFHRIIPGFMCQGGDVIEGDGSGGVSIYGDAFADEAFPFSHAGAGLLAMANSGPDSNKSQFFVTLGDCTWLDGKHVVFGRVLSGGEVFEELEALGDSTGVVSGTAVVAACGVCEDL